MNVPTVWWGIRCYSSKESKEHYRIVHAGAKAWSKLAACAIIASQSIDKADRCVLLKLARKPRPKVVAKDITTQIVYSSCVCCSRPGTANEPYEHRFKWLRVRQGKRVRITLEELES